jgi:hypothetical protein
MEKQISENIFSKENIKSQSNIRLTDFDEDSKLELYCYTQCSNSDSEFIKNIRGVVFSGENLILRSFPYSDDYNHHCMELKTVLQNFSSWVFYKSYEGTLLRLFYFSGKWFLSTHRKLNAFKSRWSGQESFGTLFKFALEHEFSINENFKFSLGEGETMLDKFYSSLDTTKQYMFLIRNTNKNRIVCNPPLDTDTKLFSVGYFQKGEFVLETTNFLRLPEKVNLNNFEELQDYFKNEVDIKNIQGLICFKDGNFRIKISHSDYEKSFKLRGNESSVKFRYLQIRSNNDLVKSYYELYPDMIPVFENYERYIIEIAKIIYRSYIQRFIKKNFITLPTEEFLVMNDCHKWHILNREQNRISLEQILTVLNKQPANNINHMIKRYTGEQNHRKYSSTSGNIPTPLLLCNVANWKRS